MTTGGHDDGAGHPDDLLSALVDGELGPTEEARARRHVAACPRCREEAETAAWVRDVLAALPPVEPPAEYHRRLAAIAGAASGRARRLAGNVLAPLAAAVGFALVLTGGTGTAGVAPAIGGALSTHAATTATLPSRGSGAEAAAATPDLGHPFVAPPALAGMTRVAARTIDGGVHLVYAAGPGRVVSVFEYPGSLDWERLPSDGTDLGHADLRLWYAERGGHGVLVWDSRDAVFVAVSRGGPEELVGVVEAMPAPGPPTWLDRARDASRRAVAAFDP